MWWQFPFADATRVTWRDDKGHAVRAQAGGSQPSLLEAGAQLVRKRPPVSAACRYNRPISRSKPPKSTSPFTHWRSWPWVFGVELRDFFAPLMLITRSGSRSLASRPPAVSECSGLGDSQFQQRGEAASSKCRRWRRSRRRSADAEAADAGGALPPAAKRKSRGPCCSTGRR